MTASNHRNSRADGASSLALAQVQRENRLAMIQEQNPQELATKIQYMVQNGKKLAPPEALALAMYAIATDLNPFAQECYYIPNVGPVPGIAGWRRKAQEQLVYEASLFGVRSEGHFITYDYREADPKTEAAYDPSKGDVAYVCTVRDTISREKWLAKLMETARELKGIVDKPLDEAERLIGPEPSWTGVGTVYGAERFSYDNKPEKFDRGERAKKRAERIALRKRFARIDLPDTDVYIDDGEYPASDQQQYIDAEVQQPSRAYSRAAASETEALAALGYDAEPEPAHETVDPAPEYESKARMSAEEVKIRIAELTAKYEANNRDWSEGKRGLVVPVLEEALFGTGDPKLNRQAVLKYLTGKSSYAEVSEAAAHALYSWLEPTKDTGGSWSACEAAIDEARAILRAAMPEQEKLF